MLYFGCPAHEEWEEDTVGESKAEGISELTAMLKFLTGPASRSLMLLLQPGDNFVRMTIASLYLLSPNLI